MLKIEYLLLKFVPFFLYCHAQGGDFFGETLNAG